jgi:ribosomal protein S27AE
MRLSRTCYACGKSVLARHRVIARGMGNGEGLRVICSTCHLAERKEADFGAVDVWIDQLPAERVWIACKVQGCRK